MEGGATRDALLRKAGLTTRDWIATERRWLAAIAQELARGERTLASQYVAIYLAHGGRPAAQPSGGQVAAAGLAVASPGSPGSVVALPTASAAPVTPIPASG
jgi:hypothetical protein